MTQTSQKLNFSVKQANIKRQTRRKITYKLNIYLTQTLVDGIIYSNLISKVK